MLPMLTTVVLFRVSQEGGPAEEGLGTGLIKSWGQDALKV